MEDEPLSPANENFSPDEQREADAFLAAFAEALAAHQEMQALEELYARALGKLEDYLASPAVGGATARALLAKAESLFAAFSEARDKTDPYVIDEGFFALAGRLAAAREAIARLP